MVHEDYKEMIPARALSALDAAEDRELSKHLSECAECRHELEDWQATSVQLVVAAEPAEPSPQVRELLLSAIRSDARITESGLDDEIPGAQILPFASPSKNIWSSVGSLGAMAAAVLFVALLISVLVLWQQNRAMQREMSRLAAEMRGTEQKLERAQALSKLLTAPGARMTSLAATKEAPGAKAMLAYDQTGHAMLMAKGLSAPPSGKAYQLWYIVGNKPMPGKVFTTDESGNGMLDEQLPQVALNGAVFAITMEPLPGVESPTGAILLSGS